MTEAMGTLTFHEVVRNQMTGYEGKEVVPMNYLDVLIENLDEIYEKNNIAMRDHKNNTMTLDQIRTALQKYRVNRRHGKRIVYKFARNRNQGRLFSQTLSGQGMSRSIRHTLFRADYIDIDIVNCHPVLLSWYCHQQKWDCPHLDRYIQDRDAILSGLMEYWDLPKEDVKNMFLVMMNGGGPGLLKHDEFVHVFFKEMERILKSILETATPEERNLPSKDDNIAGSILNHRICCIENFILKKMVEFVEGNSFKNLILCFDGFMVHKSASHLLPPLQAHLDQLGIPNLRVISKPMDNHFDISIYTNVATLPINPPLDHDPDYNLNHFELEFAGKSFPSMDEFKLQVIPKYCKVFAHFRDFPQPIYRCQDNKFKFGFPNTDYYNWIVGEKKVNLTDIVRLFPLHVPRYENYDFYPDGYNVYGEPCPPSILNLWSGFQATRLPTYDPQKIEPFLSHLRLMWADDDESIYEYLIDLFAHIIQYPWKKVMVLLLLYSLPRAGKNIITNFFLNKVIGKDYGSDNLGIDLLVCRFNETLIRQLFVVCNELPQLTTTNRNSVFDALKTAITDNERTYEIKGGRKWSGPNYVNLICTTNHDFTYHIEQNDGRVLALRCSDRFRGNLAYFSELASHLQQDNADHLITFLYERKITHDLRVIPMTDLKKEMIVMSLPSPARFIQYIRETPDAMDELVQMKYPTSQEYPDNPLRKQVEAELRFHKRVRGSNLHDLFHAWCVRFHENPMSMTACGNIWKKDCDLAYTRIKGVIYYLFPDGGWVGGGCGGLVEG